MGDKFDLLEHHCKRNEQNYIQYILYSYGIIWHEDDGGAVYEMWASLYKLLSIDLNSQYAMYRVSQVTDLQ
jgi:hypothetical protein